MTACSSASGARADVGATGITNNVVRYKYINAAKLYVTTTESGFKFTPVMTTSETMVKTKRARSYPSDFISESRC